jgi:hypothetical protein
MKPSRPVTLPALLEGVFMLFAMLDPLEHYSPRHLCRNPNSRYTELVYEER